MAFADVVADINEHVKGCLSSHKPDVRDAKVIHDPIHGSNLFCKEEVAVMDLPLVQRLRYVSQTDVASLIYPSCHHTRFDHSLGVAVIAGKFIDAIANTSSSKDLIGPKERLEIRLAALLHDIGHGPFSHLSELRYGEGLLTEARKAHPRRFGNAKPHEVLSYLMVTCEAFRDYFSDEIAGLSSVSSIDLDSIGNMIVGKMDDPNTNGFMGDIINGVFDADKLDYIQRDAYFSGLRMAVDLDRILHSVWVPMNRAEGLPRHLAVRIGAVSALEQIMFDKVQLFSAIYHHQKVRSAECLMQSIFELLADGASATVNGHALSHPADFLKVTDADILFGHTDSARLSDYVERLKDRRLLKRALVICPETIESPKQSGLSELNALAEDAQGLRALRGLIADQCSVDLMDLWIDLPLAPSLREPSQFYVCEPGGVPRKLEAFFPTEDWLTTYSQNKLRGHVFCSSDGTTRKRVADCAAEVLREKYGIVFKPIAHKWAKHPEE